MMRPTFRPSNWYWIIAGSTTQVYSSAATAYVPVTDANYVAWLAKGNLPTKIAVEQDLFDVLSGLGIPIPTGATISDAEKTRQLSKTDKIIFKILFNHENRIRTLAGQPQITTAQFITAVKSLI